jgi:predicted transposase/invertase (TIGR01784 family)
MGLINELIDNITEDPLYQQGVLKGREEGIEKGILKGREEGIEKGMKNVIIKMLKDRTLSIEKIAELTEVTIEYVQQVANELKD